MFFVGIIIIIIEVTQIGLETKNWCNYELDELENHTLSIFYTSNLKILSFLFSSFLAYFSIDQLSNIEKQGMYYKMHYVERLKWINKLWLNIGFSVNLFVAVIAVYGSFLVIFFSDNPLDMVLNSVALFFIVELDNLLITTENYDKIYKFVNLHKNDETQIILIKEKKIHNNTLINFCYNCCNKITLCGGWLSRLPFQILKYLTISLCVIMPIFVAICY